MECSAAVRTRAWCAIVFLVTFGSLAGAAVADAPAPVNDDYLRSFRLEDGQHRTPRRAALDVQDTTAATVQADLLVPAGSGGGVEPTNCDGVNYGRTIWYDVNPDQYGAIHLQSAGRDGVIAVYQYDPRTLRLGKLVRCVNEPGLQDQLDVYLDKGKSYTVQLGGVDPGSGPAGGQVQFTEQFFDDSDRDQVVDVVDKCVGTKGTSRLKGCLPELDVVPVLNWTFARGGVSVDELVVTDVAGRGGKVTASCCGGRHFGRKFRRHKADFSENFKRPLPFGSTLTLTVIRPGAVGRRFRWTISSAGVGSRKSTCLVPATDRPPEHGTKCQ
jgi:hypothetical protein